MGKSIRWVIRNRFGRVPCNFNWSIITSRSVVHITAAQVQFGTTIATPVSPGQDFYYIRGAADIWITNIMPHKNDFSGQPGGVTFYLHIAWNSPIDVAVTITVEDAVPIEIQGYNI